MKKLLVLSMVFASFVSYGQEFMVTTEGLKDKSNIEKTFVVINVEGKTAKQLYDNAVLYVNTTYKNPSAVMRGNVNGEFLSFTTHSDFKVENGFSKAPFTMDYLTSLTFKDGKVKYEIQELDMLSVGTQPRVKLWWVGNALQFSIFNKSNEVKREGTKSYLEEYFNQGVSNVKTYLEGKSSTTKKDDF